MHIDLTQQYPSQNQPPSQLTEITHSTRNLVMLSNTESIAPHERGELGVFYNNRKTPKLSKVHHEICPITSLPARYRDPKTRVAYANSNAYQKLRQLKQYGYVWSGMLGCYVGTTGLVARGVPEGFLSELPGPIMTV